MRLWRIVPRSSSSNLRKIISHLLDTTWIRSNVPKLTNASLVSILSKLTGIFSDVQNVQSGVKSSSVLPSWWVILLPTVTHSSVSPSYHSKIPLQGILGALSNQHFQMNPNNREPVFCILVNSQNKIGWQHLLKGRFSKQWTQIQGRHILDDPELDHEKQ